MVNMNKSYQENIALDDNRGYAKLVDQLIDNGKIDDKYMTFISTQDIVNAIYLYVLKVSDILIYYNMCKNHNKFDLPGTKKTIYAKTDSFVGKQETHYNSIYENYIDGKHDATIMACSYGVSSKVDDYPEYDSYGKRKIAHSLETDLPKFNGFHINDVFDIWNTLPKQSKEVMLFSIGLEKLLDTGLDKVKIVEDTLKEIAARTQAAQAAIKAAALANNNPP